MSVKKGLPDCDLIPLVDGNGRFIPDESGQPIFDEVVADDNLDLSAEQEYLDKCAFLSNSFKTGFDMTEVYLRDFLDMIFVRYGDEPYEDIGAHNYQVWYKQVSAGVDAEHIDYSECDDRRKWNAVVLTRMLREKRKTEAKKYYERCEQWLVLRKDWKFIDWLEKRYFALMAPITYKGKSTKAEDARMLFAFGVDLDDVGMEQLECLFLYINRRYPAGPLKDNPIIMPPNIIVNSGHGLHLYYILEHPIPLGKYSTGNNALLKYLSDRLYNMAWWPYNEKNGEPGTSKNQKVAHLGIYHPFRIPGTLTKPLRYNKATQRATGMGLHIRAWSLDIPNYTIDDFVKRWGYDDEFKKKFTPEVITKLQNGDRILDPKHMTREEAMKAYPNWNPDAAEKGHYEINRRLYDSWLNKMRDPERAGVREGHRYYCIVALVAFAKKCGIPFEEVSRDAYSLLDVFDSLEARSDNRFVRNDIKKALSFYFYDKAVRYSRLKLEASTGIPMPKTKRNGRTREENLIIARTARDVNDRKYRRKWDAHNGPKTVKLRVQMWCLDHPYSCSKTQCAKDCTCMVPERDPITHKKTGRMIEKHLDPHTVAKWWWHENPLTIPEAVLLWRHDHPDIENKSLCARECGITRPTVIKWWNCTAEDAKAEFDRLNAVQEAGLAAIKAKKTGNGYERMEEHPSELQDLGAAVNTGYIIDKKIAAMTMQHTEGYSAQDEDTIRKTGDELADAINFGALNVEDLMRSMGFPEYLIPIMKGELQRQMQTPEFWEEYNRANPNVDTSRWPPQFRRALDEAVEEHNRKK